MEHRTDMSANGSTEEAVTCPAISLLCILVLFYMAPYRKFLTASWKNVIIITLRTTFPILMGGVLTGSFIEFSAKYFTSPAEKATFGGMFGGIIFMFIFFVIIRIIDMVGWRIYTKEKYEKMLAYIAGITGVILLVMMVSSIITVSVYLAKYHSDAAWKEKFGAYFTLLTFPIIMVLFPVGLSVFWIICSRWMGRTVRLKDFLLIIGYFLYNHALFNMLMLAIYSQLFAWMNNTFRLEYSIPIAVAALGLCACIYVKIYLLYREEKRLVGFYYFAQKILLGIFFMLHLILSCLYLSVILENDKGRPVRICEFVLIYILTVTFLFRFWLRQHFLAKPRKYLYLSGAFVLPLLNSVALAVALKLKADTGKQPLDLRLIVLISGSVFLFPWLVIQMSAYWLAKKEKIKKQLGLVERLQDTELELKRYRALYDYNAAEEDEVSFQHSDVILGMQHFGDWIDGRVERTGQRGMVPANYVETIIEQQFNLYKRHQDPEPDQGSHDNQETELSSPADHNEPNPEEVLLGEKNTEV